MSATDTGIPRDIDLVLVTGAGASRSFGRPELFPLMQHFSEAVIKRIEGAQSQNTTAMRKVLPLVRGMTGPEFEHALGSFLRQAQAFRDMEPLLKPSLDLVQLQPHLRMILPSSNASALEDWHYWMRLAIDELVGLLNQTLFELFSGSIDVDAAASGYDWLLAQLRVTTDSSLVYATTNYDFVGEQALSKLGYRIDWGRRPQLTNASAEEPVRVERLIEGLPGNVPMLHLHGSVRWFVRPNAASGQVHDMIVSNYNKEWGIPVVVWPDDTKDASTYSVQPVIDQLWRQFQVALGRARKVVVLGHSLHDPYLTEAIRTNVPTQRLAVTMLADDLEHAAKVERIRGDLGDVAIVLLEFEGSPRSDGELADWAYRVDTLD